MESNGRRPSILTGPPPELPPELSPKDLPLLSPVLGHLPTPVPASLPKLPPLAFPNPGSAPIPPKRTLISPKPPGERAVLPPPLSNRDEKSPRPSGGVSPLPPPISTRKQGMDNPLPPFLVSESPDEKLDWSLFEHYSKQRCFQGHPLCHLTNVGLLVETTPQPKKTYICPFPKILLGAQENLPTIVRSTISFYTEDYVTIRSRYSAIDSAFDSERISDRVPPPRRSVQSMHMTKVGSFVRSGSWMDTNMHAQSNSDRRRTITVTGSGGLAGDKEKKGSDTKRRPSYSKVREGSGISSSTGAPIGAVSSVPDAAKQINRQSVMGEKEKEMRIAAYKEKEEKCGPGTTVDVALLTPNRDGYVIPRFDNSPAILCTPSPRVTRNVLEGLIPFDTPAKPVRLQVECNSLAIEFGSNFEPYYCSLALYDMCGEGNGKPVKISADFKFELNSPALMTTIMDGYGQDPILQLKKCIFTLDSANPNVVLFLKIAKVIRPGDTAALDKLYMKPATAKQKEIDKLMKETKELLPHETMQYFAWACTRLFGDNGSLLADNIILTELRPVKAPFSDEGTLEALEKESEKKEKVKCIKGQFEATISLLQDDVAVETVDENLFSTRQYPAPTYAGEAPPMAKTACREIQDFGQFLNPGRSYVNQLYLYPESLQLKHSTNVVLEFQLFDRDDNDPSNALPLMHSPYGAAALSASAITWTTPKERKDQFSDEIVLNLPAHLGSTHHILVTIHSINHSSKKRDKSVLGYVIIPLFADNRLIPNDSHAFPVASTIAAGYLASTQDSNYLDGKKPIFSIRTRVVSSLYTTDHLIANFFHAMDCERRLQKEGGELIVTKAMEDAIVSLRGLCGEDAILHLASLLDNLLRLMGAKEEADMKILGTIVCLINNFRDIMYPVNLNAFLQSYVWFWHSYGYNNKGTPRYPYITRAWLGLIEEHKANTGTKLFTGHETCFLLDMIIKSMILKMQEENQLAPGTDRSKIFEPAFLDNLEALMHKVLAPNKLAKGQYGIFTATRFIQNLLNVSDKGRLFNWMRSYFKKMEPDDQHTVKVKFSILKSLADDVNFVPLCLPVAVPILSVTTIQSNFWRVHYFSGQILNEVSNCLTDFNSPDVNFCRKFAIDSLNTIFAKLVNQVKSQDNLYGVTEIFFPFIPTFAKNILVIEQFTTTQKNDWVVVFVSILGKTWKDLLLSYWKKETQRGVSLFCKALSTCVSILSSGRAVQARPRQMTVLAGSPADGDYSDMTMMDLKRMRDLASSTPDADENTNFLKNAFADIGQCILNFLECFQSEIAVPESPVAEAIFSVIHGMTKVTDADILMDSGTFYVLKIFIQMFGDALFKHTNKYTLVLMYEILRHCSTSNRQVRSQACAAFYIMLDSNFKTTGGYEKISVISSVALSELLGKSAIASTTYLTESLQTVQSYAEEVLGKDPSNSNQLSILRGVMKRNTTLLQYNQTIVKVSSSDPELTTDLYQKISNSYVEAPDTRVQWLDNMATYHQSHKHYLEAALCKVHHAALVLEYLQRYSKSEKEKQLPILRTHLQVVSPGLAREASLPDFEEDKMQSQFQLSTWSIDGLIELLETAVKWLKEDKQHDLCLEIYSILEVIFKYLQSYDRLKQCLLGYTESVGIILEDQQRIQAKYYRASFYGPKTGDLEGKSFIYRLDASSSLLSFTNKIKTSLKDAVKSPEDFVMLPNKPVEESTIDPEKIYLQIGGVTVYHGDTEALNPYQQHHNISQFIFEMSHQKTQKKKLIYYVESPFPSVKTRMEIVKQDELILSPIEAAIENVNDRVKAIRAELTAAAPRVNTLQQILQGSVVPMVNEGPLKICADFLAPEVVDNFDAEKVSLLRDTLRDFIRNCGFALRLNARLIDEKHKPFQDMCQQKYEELSKMIKTYLEVD